MPLPDDLIETIAAYLRRHEKYDDAASDRLQEELLLIFDKNVRGNPAASGAWLSILRRLLTVLRTPERILVWLEACKGILDKTGFDKNIVAEAMETLKEIVAIADEYHDGPGKDSASNPLVDRLFEIWMDEFHPARFEGFQPSEHVDKMISDALGQFGKKRPKVCIPATPALVPLCSHCSIADQAAGILLVVGRLLCQEEIQKIQLKLLLRLYPVTAASPTSGGPNALVCRSLDVSPARHIDGGHFGGADGSHHAVAPYA